MAQMADDLHVATRDESGTMVSLRFTLRDSRAGFD
jgi:hypothetical protein